MNWPAFTAYLLIVMILFSWLFDTKESRKRNITWLAVMLIMGAVLVLLACCSPSKKAPKKEKKWDYEWGPYSPM